MGCVQNKGLKVPSQLSKSLPKPKGSGKSSQTSVDVLDFKVDYEADKAVDKLNAERKLGLALQAKRRGDVFDESFEAENVEIEFHNNPLVDKDSKKKKFLEEALHNNILFRDVLEEQMDKLLRAMTKKKVKKDKIIIQQGEKGDKFYIVETGSFSISVDGETKGTCKEGQSFGELALLYNSPRAATIQAEEDSVVWVLERNAFRHVIAGTINRRQNDIKKALRSVSIFSNLSSEQVAKIANAVERVYFKAGDTIIRKGDDGHLFYLIKTGSVQCTRAGAGSRESSVDLTLDEGHYFGERALMKDEPRAANVIALQDTECLVLDREAFHEMLGDLRDVLDENLSFRVLSSVPLLQNLKQSELRKLMKALKEETYKRGDQIIKQGDEGSKFFLMKEGLARVVVEAGAVDPAEKSKDVKKRGSDGTEVAELAQGDYFGEAALLNSAPRNSTVEAVSEKVVCLTLERSAFEKLLGPLQKIMKRQLDERDDERNTVVKSSQAAVESTLKLSDLKMLKTLGTGTFGRVKLVECAKLNKTYALKILQKSQVVAYRQQQNVINEKELLLECDHPFILRLYRTFKDKHCLYYLLELVQGGELFTLLHVRGGSLGNADARFYASCVVSGLEYLHSKRIVYRDLKPENLMIDQVGYIKIVDFGFAKKLASGGKTYTLCGTPEYLAPEIILSKGHNHAVDNWAVGILMFEMLTGSSPFADHVNNDHMTICKNIVRGKVDYPRKFNDKAKDLCGRLLLRDAHLRLGSLKGGTAEIRQHPWFKAVDFNELTRKRTKAPWVPEIKSALDTSNFDDYDEDDFVEAYKSRGSDWAKDF